MNTNIRALYSLAIICSFSTVAWGQDEGLRIYISADMEGVVGVVTGEQLGPGGFEYERFREFMTAEVNATDLIDVSFVRIAYARRRNG